MDHLKLGRSSKKKEVGKRRGLAIIYDGFNLVGNRIDIRDFRSRNPLQGRRNWGAIAPHPPDYGRNNSKIAFSFKRPPPCIFRPSYGPAYKYSNTIVVILLVGVDKGQLISKCHFGIFNSPKKRTKKFDFTTIVPHVELFSFVFWEN